MTATIPNNNEMCLNVISSFDPAAHRKEAVLRTYGAGAESAIVKLRQRATCRDKPHCRTTVNCSEGVKERGLNGLEPPTSRISRHGAS